MSTNPGINKAIHALLMHGFGTLNTLFSGLYPRNKWKHSKQIDFLNIY